MWVKKGVKIEDELERLIIKEYNDGYSNSYLANKYNVNRSTVQKCLIRNNIPLRKCSPHFHYDVHFFDQYNPSSCYWAGFIAADGYIRDDRDATVIHLCNDDISHLYKIKELTKYEGKISNSKNECSIMFSGKWFGDKLYENYGLTPRKTHTVSIPKNIPHNMLKHYIRGYFDGDGCISDIKGYPAINFASSSETMLEELIEIFKNLEIKLQTQIGQPKIQGIHINYTCSNAMKILKWMYEDSTYLTRLDRKYNKYLSYVDRKYEKIKYE